MKKLIAYSLSLAVVLGLVTPALADVRSELEAKRAEIQTQIKENQDKLQEARDNIKNLGQENKDLRTMFRFDIAKHRADIAGRVFNASIDRLNKLIDRINSRITKLNAAGASTTDATNFVNLAKGNITDAQTHMSILTSLDVSTTTLATTTAKQNWDTVKSEAKIIRDFLVKAKQNLQKAVNVLARLQKDYHTSDEDKSSGKDNNDEGNSHSTSTASTTNPN